MALLNTIEFTLNNRNWLKMIKQFRKKLKDLFLSKLRNILINLRRI